MSVSVSCIIFYHYYYFCSKQEYSYLRTFSLTGKIFKNLTYARDRPGVTEVRMSASFKPYFRLSSHTTLEHLNP